MNRTFYENRKLTESQRLWLFREAWERSGDKWFDELDCKKSFARRQIDMSLDDFIWKLKSSDFVQWRYIKEQDISTGDEMFEIFVRFDNWWNEPMEDETGKYLLRRNRDLFGWVRIPYEDAYDLIDEYGLRKVK